ncbi:MAG: PadR family transcriptional regulator [Chloroflexota bacterium]
MNDKQRRHRGRRRHRQDFWHDWQERQQELHNTLTEGEQTPPPPFQPRQRAKHWREFFHEFTGSAPERHWAFSGRRFNPWHQGVDSFNPFVASLLSKGGGLLPLYVLHLLEQQPQYGNEIMEKLAERTANQWVANPGAIYPLMTVLEEQGIVQGQWEDPRKRTVRIYELTEKGKQELANLKAIVRPKLLEAIEVLQTLADDLNGDSDSEWL